MSRGWIDEAHGRVLTGPAARSLQQFSRQFANGVCCERRLDYCRVEVDNVAP
jgi:hypothetical protein